MSEDVQEFIRQEVERQMKVRRVTVNAKDAALILGVCEDTLLADCRAGKVPHVRIRGRYVFHIPTIEKWLEEQSLANAKGA